MKAEQIVMAMITFSFLTLIYEENIAQTSSSNPEETYDDIVKVIDVASVWSVHQIGSPDLITSDEFQYVGYYDEDRFLTVAQRKLGTQEWTYYVFPVQMGWATGGHARLTLALDRDGYLHVSSYRRTLQEGPPAPPEKIYYRSENPHEIQSFERLIMISDDEAPEYPTFVKGPNDELYFTYRQGGSGSGDQIFNIYDPETRSWERLHDTPLFDGQGEMNAYGGPRLGPDGIWHATWVWRNTPDNATNHSVSYARSRDMRNWETVDGKPVDLPITSETEGVIVDPAGPGDGISNMTSGGLGWDTQQRTIRTYHKFDEYGNSQVVNARFEDGHWNIVQATDWDFRWNYEGRGALPSVVLVGNVKVGRKSGTLELDVWSQYYGDERIVLDENNLEPIKRTEPDETPEWEKAIKVPELDFQVEPDSELLRDGGPMEVTLIEDMGEATHENVKYILRWENAGRNRDRPVPEPWPEPTMLRVFKIAK
ncbi:MAG: BNR repeat-containing protein [Balneolaceae bacterium]|nr:BNR repeat-containing protein [Balneolaceae bacterium]